MIKKNGFTLIELMMAVAMMGILLSIAIPQYKQYVIRSNRVAMQAEIMQIVAGLERQKAIQLTYNGATLQTLYGSTNNPPTYPKTAQGRAVLYSLFLKFPPDAAVPRGAAWVLSALPENTQFGDGAMAVDNTGRRCWNKDNQNGCTLSDPNQAWSSR